MTITRIISSGAKSAALDVAIQLKIPYGVVIFGPTFIVIGVRF